VFGQVDLIGCGELLHPLSEPHSVAVRGVDHLEIVADRFHDDLTRN
jgi:hypothetical protein